MNHALALLGWIALATFSAALLAVLFGPLVRDFIIELRGGRRPRDVGAFGVGDLPSLNPIAVRGGRWINHVEPRTRNSLDGR